MAVRKAKIRESRLNMQQRIYIYHSIFFNWNSLHATSATFLQKKSVLRINSIQFCNLQAVVRIYEMNPKIFVILEARSSRALQPTGIGTAIKVTQLINSSGYFAVCKIDKKLKSHCDKLSR